MDQAPKSEKYKTGELLNTYAVIDFEITRLAPDHGAHPTEIAVVLVKNDKIIDSDQSLMNPGVYIPYEMHALSGISNEMARKAPSPPCALASCEADYRIAGAVFELEAAR